MPISTITNLTTQWFLQILNMTFTATIIIIIIAVARVTVLKKLPKIYSYVLWSVVLFRLICPFSMESSMSIFHMNNYKIFQEEAEKNPIIGNNLYHEHTIYSADEFIVDMNYTNEINLYKTNTNSENILAIISYIWIVGATFMFLKSYISYYNLKKMVSNSKKINGVYSNIYVSKNISTAIVIGFIFPRIYLPKHITQDKSKRYILFHEKIHIKRLDHITRIVSYFALCVHWFNPFVWWAFNLSNNDMEMSCDEKVIERLNCKSDYSTSLLNMAVKNLEYKENKNIVYPLAFSKGDVKKRIKNVLNYKKPSIVISIIAVITLGVATYSLVTDPTNSENIINENNFIEINDIQKEEVEKEKTESTVVENTKAGISDDDMLNAFSEIFNIDIDDYDVDISVDKHGFEGAEIINKLKYISLNNKNHTREFMYSVQDKDGVLYEIGASFQSYMQSNETAKINLTEEEKVEFSEIAKDVLNILNLETDGKITVYETWNGVENKVAVAFADEVGNIDLVHIMYHNKGVCGYGYIDAKSELKEMMFSDDGELNLFF